MEHARLYHEKKGENEPAKLREESETILIKITQNHAYGDKVASLSKKSLSPMQVLCLIYLLSWTKTGSCELVKTFSDQPTGRKMKSNHSIWKAPFNRSTCTS